MFLSTIWWGSFWKIIKYGKNLAKYEKIILPCLQVQPKCDISPKPECWIPESDTNDDDDVVDLRDARGLMLCMQL